jgi:NodT family efflux transporter outer membrane factor (OMF) lipoprotein
VQKGVNSREAAFNASEADWRAGYLTLIADVASTYFQIRETDELIAQQQWTIDKNQQILAINQAQFSEGLVSAVQVMQQEAEISRLQQQLQDFQRVRQIAENQLATLLGTPAGEFKVPVANLSNTVNLLDVPSGLPSDLLERRPDIIAAEYRVLEANELIGKAKLAKLPRLSLTSTANRNIVSSALTGLIKTWTLGLGPAIDIPLFDPSLEAQVKVNEAQTQTVSEEYRRTVITAFEEVENALVNLANRKTQKETLEKQIDTLRVVNDQVYAQLREGLVSQLEVFESERRLLEAQQDLLQLQQQLHTDTVTLYHALGGGWPKEHLELAKPESGDARTGRSKL